MSGRIVGSDIARTVHQSDKQELKNFEETGYNISAPNGMATSSDSTPWQVIAISKRQSVKHMSFKARIKTLEQETRNSALRESTMLLTSGTVFHSSRDHLGELVRISTPVKHANDSKLLLILVFR